ncbi:flagellar hook-length control protein FliK [Nitrobacter sp. NHB1]|uniref:flagellar hook-length control protein FliK n=1 Tax=Nitrobacter sp. NHB1 TaxID=3119830 RepID=UPI002FFFF319
MLSVTPETTTGVSLPNARQRSERDNQSTDDTFGVLVDTNAQASQASTAQTSNSSDRHDMRPERLADASRRDRTVPADDNAQTRGSQASSGQPPQTNSAGPGTNQKPATGTEASNGTHHHRAKHKGTEGASTGDASDPMLAAPGATTADPTVPPQPVTTPVAVAVPVAIPVAATLSAAAAPAVTGAAGALPAQAASAAQVTPADTGFNPVAAADTAASTAAMQTGDVLAAAVAAATPATAKATAKTPDTAQLGKQQGKTTASVMTGLQPGLMPPDVTAPPAASGNPVAPHDAAVGDHKHDAVASDGAKTASSDTGTLATQPGAAAPQHSAQATDATAPQLQPGQTDSGQPQGLNSAFAQQQVQSTAATTPVTPQYNVAAAAGAAVPLNGLAVQIAVTALSGKSRFEIRLDPADLGRIDVRLDVDRQGRVTSHLTVDKPETLAMLRQDAPQLQRALQDAGLKTGDGGLQFSLRDQSSQGQTARDDTGRNARRLIVTEDAIVPAAAAGRNYGRILGSSRGLDIRV